VREKEKRLYLWRELVLLFRRGLPCRLFELRIRGCQILLLRRSTTIHSIGHSVQRRSEAVVELPLCREECFRQLETGEPSTVPPSDKVCDEEDEQIRLKLHLSRYQTRR